jgi:hypothetical protein
VNRQDHQLLAEFNLRSYAHGQLHHLLQSYSLFIEGEHSKHLLLTSAQAISFPDVRSAGSTNLRNRLNRTTFLSYKHVRLRMNILTCAQLKLDDSAEFQISYKHVRLRMNILTCAQLKLDDSAEFQIVPTISNQISILYSINLSC